MPEKEVTLDLHGVLSPCRRGFRVGFGSRMVSFCQILTDFNLPGLSEAARNDTVGSCGSTWHVGKILPYHRPAKAEGPKKQAQRKIHLNNRPQFDNVASLFFGGIDYYSQCSTISNTHQAMADKGASLPIDLSFTPVIFHPVPIARTDMTAQRHDRVDSEDM